MNTSSIAITVLMVLGGAIYLALAGLHAIYTWLDARNPRRLAPVDPKLREAMTASGVRLAPGTMSMWDAWIGFNYSHSFGGILLGAIAVAAPFAPWPLPPLAFALFAAFSGLYLAVGLRYWFRIPTTGIGIATACFLAAWLLAITKSQI